MIRSQLILALLLGVLPSSAFAQFELSAHGGVHLDRAPEHDRVVTERGAAMYADQGEASAFGGRLGYWRNPRFGLQFDLSRSSNASWSGSTPLPPPAFANRTTYLSARAVARTSPAKSLQLAVAAGPAMMIYSGPGTNLRTRGADVGGVLEVSARLRIVHQLGFEVAVSNYFYGSSYGVDPTLGGGQAGGTRNVFRHDLLLMPGLVYSWR
jgi:hypothetical protein